MNPFADLDPEVQEHLSRIASPAHLAQFCTSIEQPEDRWQPAKHLLYLNRRLVEVYTSPDKTYLNVALSVRHGKSQLITMWSVVWFLMLNPNKRVIIVSYNEVTAAQFGEWCRDTFAAWAPTLVGLEPRTSSESKVWWHIKGHKGYCLSVGVGGSLTGKGGELIVIDDPVKGDEDAHSEAARAAMWRWYVHTLRTRLQPGGTMVLVMSRWHEDDLTGRIEDYVEKAQAAGTPHDPWEFIRLPAIAESPKGADPDTWRDVLGRKDGDPLWPELWPLSELMPLKYGDRMAWQALYQQNPISPEGDLFKVQNWQRKQRPNHDSLRLVRYWDTAATAGRGDWTVGALVGMDVENRVWILDIVRGRWSAANVEAKMKQTAAADGKGVPIRWEVERAGAGKALASAYVRMLVGYDAAGSRIDGNKEIRARALAAQHEEGNVFIPYDAPWADALIEEAQSFPRGRHDDQVDAVTGGFNYLAEGGFAEIVTEDDMATPLSAALDAMLGNNPYFDPAFT